MNLSVGKIKQILLKTNDDKLYDITDLSESDYEIVLLNFQKLIAIYSCFRELKVRE